MDAQNKPEYEKLTAEKEQLDHILRDTNNGRGLNPRERGGYKCSKMSFESRGRHGSNLSDVYVSVILCTPYRIEAVSPAQLTDLVREDLSRLCGAHIELNRHTLDNLTFRCTHEAGPDEQKHSASSVVTFTFFGYGAEPGRAQCWAIHFLCSDAAAEVLHKVFLARHPATE